MWVNLERMTSENLKFIAVNIITVIKKSSLGELSLPVSAYRKTGTRDPRKTGKLGPTTLVGH